MNDFFDEDYFNFIPILDYFSNLPNQITLL